MGLSGGSSSKSGSAQTWARPFAKAAASSVQDTFNANQGGLQKLTDTVAGTVPTMNANVNSWQPMVGQSQGHYSGVVGGKYLDPSNNPGLTSVLDRMRGDVSDEVNSQFELGGRYGSGAHTGVLTDRLADAEGNVLYGNYNAERERQDAAASIAPQAQNQSLAALLQSAGVSAELPYTGTNNLASSLSALFSGGTQKQSTGIAGVLGGLGSIASGVGALGGSGGAAALFSDRRLKSNIVKLGEMDDGLGIYEYDIFGERQRGVMADEVEALRPWALGPTVEGFQTVKYQDL